MKRASVTVVVIAFLGSISALATDLSLFESAESFEAARKKWLIEDSKRQIAAKTRDDRIKTLKAELSAPWSFLVVACRYDCSCTGTSFNGFKIVREKDTFSVAPWSESKGAPGSGETGRTESMGDTRPLSKSAVEQLLSETVLYFLAATLSVDPLEKVGRPPEDDAKHADWMKEYLAAGGYPMAGDHFWIEVRISTPNGLKKHSDMFDDHAPADFFRWIAAFGEVKKPLMATKRSPRLIKRMQATARMTSVVSSVSPAPAGGSQLQAHPMKRLLNASLILMLVSYSAAFGWTRHVVALQEATKRAEVILIGRIKTDSIVRVTHPQRAGGGASWEHQAVLVVGGVMKGELTDKEIPIVIHYGIDPIVGRKLPDGKGGVVDDPVERASFSKDAIELYDNGGMRMRFTYDIREDHIWMLRHSDGSNRFDESINALGLWEPPDIQPMSQKQDVLKAICAN